MMHWVRTVLRKIAAAWAKRRHDAQRDKIEDKMVADLEAILANMKREREQVERGQNEIRRTASRDLHTPCYRLQNCRAVQYASCFLPFAMTQIIKRNRETTGRQL